MDDIVEFSGIEDAFQAGKRLFAEGKLDKAHEKLVLACVRAPQMELYRLYEQFVASRVQGKFADAGETRALAGKLAREEATSAFASYVLGYVGLEDGDRDAATKHFDNAYRLDRSLLDAGRQLRKLGLGAKITPTTVAFRVPARQKAPSRSRAFVLFGVLAFVTAGAVGYVSAARAGMFSDYVEVR